MLPQKLLNFPAASSCSDNARQWDGSELQELETLSRKEEYSRCCKYKQECLCVDASPRGPGLYLACPTIAELDTSLASVKLLDDNLGSKEPHDDLILSTN